MRATIGFLLVFGVFFALIAISLLNPTSGVLSGFAVVYGLVFVCVYALLNSIRQTKDIIKREGTGPKERKEVVGSEEQENRRGEEIPMVR